MFISKRNVKIGQQHVWRRRHGQEFGDSQCI